MKRLNKKGFTLVELLAVIVILALIMAIAIYSISGILQNSREGVFKDTGLNVIRGVKNQLLALNKQEAGKYYFTAGLLDGDNELPFGGKIKFGSTGTPITSAGGTAVIYKVDNGTSECKKSDSSFVYVDYTGGSYVYSVCLIPETRGGSTVSESSGRILAGTETALMGSTVQTIFGMDETTTANHS